MKRILLFAVVAFSFTFLLSSCMLRRGSWIITTSDDDTTVRYHYWYYPKTQVYYDYERKVYFYPENGGWQQSEQLPAMYSGDSPYETVDEDSDKPYANHEKFMTKYHPGPKMDNREKKQRDNGDENNGKAKDNRDNKENDR